MALSDRESLSDRREKRGCKLRNKKLFAGKIRIWLKLFQLNFTESAPNFSTEAPEERESFL